MRDNTVLRAAIYPRVSTMKQVLEGFSLEAQRENLNYFVNQQGWLIVGDYGDEGISGKNIEDRPGVRRLINDIKLSKVDIVVLYKFDRLTRDSRDTEDFIELIQKYGIMIYTLSGGFVDVSTPSGRFNTRILGAAAQYERETIIDRVVDGFIKKVKKGYSLCSAVTSYGYNRDKHQEVQTINEKEACVVRRIFDLYRRGKNFTQICNILNTEGIPTKMSGRVVKRKNKNDYYVINARWQSKTIKNILSNVNYIGYVRYGCNREQVSLEDASCYENRKKGFVTKGLHDAIIELDVWNDVQEKLKKQNGVSRTKVSFDDGYYCGFLECALCGHKLTTCRTKRRKKSGEFVSFLGYRCINREKHLCSAVGMSHQKVEKSFLNYIDRIVDFNVIDDLKIDGYDDYVIELNDTKKIYLKKRAKLDEITKLFMDDLLDFCEYKKMKASIEEECLKLDEKIIDVEKKIYSLKVKCDKSIISKKLRDHWMYLTQVEKKEFLSLFVKKVVIVNKSTDRHGGIPEIFNVEFYDN